jgi:NAD(P)-dependent dehydrogenase (short-subunit alcohol dehydrogenase family)
VDPLTISLQGQTAVVTGASSGIGAEITVTLARCGAQVIGVGRDPNRLVSMDAGGWPSRRRFAG